ncbi:putative disease resistance protein [Morus notabilis]|uniref:Putative disease resistance protein n=1 Tax=Morus notabilis TaxID=981085 RepID=W9S4G1_9ROSA|nr:probable disease resistance protein At4g27220 [Morus notabilis]EXC14444.1 putative disease resistance protein [Morus notabilis]
MECAASVGTSILEKIGGFLVPPVIRQLKYLFFYKKQIEKLRDCIPDLESARSRIEGKIKAATDNLDKIQTNVELWEKNAADLIQEAQQFLEAEAVARKRCCCGFCPNFVLRHGLGSKAYKTMLRVVEMSNHEPGKSGEEVSFTPERKYTNKNEGYQAFGTRNETFENIKAALKADDKTRMVLVYGTAGTGKTMLANEIAKQVEEEKLFDKVIFTAASQKPDYKRIQGDIADKLRLSTLMDKETVEERAYLLRERLANESNVLIILDDIWEELELSNVGIYFKDDQKGCKILVTSRFQHVLQNYKHTTQKFEIGYLSEDESIALFNSIVGDRATERGFQELATEIVGKCQKLPLAVSVVASVLRDKELDVWKDALERLRKSGPGGSHGMSDNLFNSIKLSYDFLDDEAQELFLLCCMREEDTNMDLHYMLTYGFGFRIFHQVYTLKDAIRRFRALVSKLRDHSLLLEGRSYVYVKVHDVVRDFGIFIASKYKAMYTIRSRDEFNHCHSEKTLRNAIALSLLYDDMGKLPEKLECPHVKLLWMWKTGSSEVPDLFFEETKELKVLDLSYAKLLPLPSSLGFLENLRVLNLCDCTLGDISEIGNLKLLQVLDMTGSTIEYLPKEIGQLSHLRELEIGRCKWLTKIHPDVLSNLKELEELNMKNTVIQWEDGDGRENASLTDLQELPNLRALHLEVESAHIKSTNLLSKKFSRYEISINTRPSIWFSNKLTAYTLFGSKILKLNLGSNLLIEELGLGMLLDCSDEVQFVGIQDVDALIPGVNKQGFLETMHMALYDTKIRYIISPLPSHPYSAFERLESLRLHTLEKLEHICHRELGSGSFCRLQQLEINKCHELKSLVSFSVAKLLVQLQEINVYDCNMIEEIITHDDQPLNNAGTIEFPQLQTLRLQSLPKLKTFFSQGLEPSKRTLVPLFSGQVQASKLTNLEVSYCESLKYLFSSAFASKLPNLYYIYMKECNMMEEIIIVDQKVEEICFPQLQYLQLQNLPKIKKFCSGISIECPLMADLKMWNCNFQGSQKIIFASESDAA